MADRKPAVLFLCTGNSCRSQMAEAITRKLGEGKVEAYSAGVSPTEIHPLARQVVEEAGYSMDGQHAKGVETYLGKLPVNYLFIVCDRAAKSCPTVWPGAPAMERIVEVFEDPAAFEGSPEETLSKFREVRDRIEARLRDWLDGLDR